MKKLSTMFFTAALVCALAVACDKEPEWTIPEEVVRTKADVGISNDEFCRCVDLENIGKTIPVVNRYLDGLDKGLDVKERARSLVSFFRSFPCVTGAKTISSEYSPAIGVSFSFKEDGITRELTLDFSSTGKVLSYHYYLATGIYVKTKKGYTIRQVFDFINSQNLDAEVVEDGEYISSLPPENLQSIKDDLNAKPYIDYVVWPVYGYLHYLTNKITLFPRMYGMSDKAYQTDWLKFMADYKLSESFGYDHSGHIVVFTIPEDPKTPNSYWEKKFNGYDFVEWAELSCNGYTISDTSIETGGDEGLVNIDSKIHIRMAEIFDRSPRTFQLHCATEKQYGSGSNPIIAVSRQTSGSIDISFKGVSETGMTCDIGPARTTIDLGALTDGTYDLNLYNGDIKQTGKLVVSAGSYAVEFNDSSTFGFTNPLLNRIPDSTIWGLVGYAKEELSSQVDSFLAALTELGAERRLYAPGDYREFWIGEDGLITDYPGAMWGYWFDRPFVFHYSGDLAPIDALVKQYKDDMSIRVATDKGEEFSSWMHNR